MRAIVTVLTILTTGIVCGAVSGCSKPDPEPEQVDMGSWPTPKPPAPHIDLSKLPGYVSKTRFGPKWPFTVDEGNLHCYHGTDTWESGDTYKTYPVTFTTRSGTEYAVNGSAMGEVTKHRWYKIKEICKSPDGDFCPGTEPIIKIGLALGKSSGKKTP